MKVNGFARATEVLELPNRNFAFVGAPIDATHGAGSIIVVNRSIGPDQDDRDPADRTYIHAMRQPFAGALGRIPDVPGGGPSTGAFRSPAALPSGCVVVSCDRAAASLTEASYAFQLCELDPATGALRDLGGEAGSANIESVVIMARPDNHVFVSRLDEPNGASRIGGGDTAEVHILDFPLLATLLFSNTREGRNVDEMDAMIGGLQVFEARPPPNSATDFSGFSDAEAPTDDFGRVFVDYRSLGSVPLNADGSAVFTVPGGAPILLQALDDAGAPLDFPDGGLFAGPLRQREQIQFYPGERIRQSFPRRFFNGVCAACHGSISGRELDIAVDVDVLTSASRTQARGQEPIRFER